MATVDPTGVFNILVQKLANLAENEIRKVVRFKGDFEESGRWIREWKELLERLHNINISDPLVIKWLQNFNDWLERAEGLVHEAQDVDPDGCSSSFSRFPGFCSSIKLKRELHNRLDLMVKEFDELKEFVPTLNLLLSAASNSNSSHTEFKQMVGPGNDSSYLELKQKVPEELVNQSEKMDEIMGLLTSPLPSSKWVGICGQGGTGKTVMAMQVNNKALDLKCFERVFFVVVGGAKKTKDVVGGAAKTNDAAKDVLRKLCDLVKCRFEVRNEISEIMAVLLSALEGKKVLLILDDVWESNLLDMLDVVDGSKGNKVLVTTRVREVVDKKNARVCSYSLLSKEDAKRLFYNHAFGTDQDCPESLRECADEIIAQCKELPLALKLVGSAMPTLLKNSRLWRLEANDIKNFEKYGDEMTGLFQYSYNKLTPKEQECFLTMLSWPEDCEISAYDLVLWWRGENLIDSLAKTGWEHAEKLLETLVGRSLIQPNSSNNNASFETFTYQLHDIILELGLKHLLKDDSKLEPHEQGHLFLSSKEHRDVLKSSACGKRLRGLRKVIGLIELPSDLEELKRWSEIFSKIKSPKLKTVIWIDNESDRLLKEMCQLVMKNYKSLQVVSIFTISEHIQKFMSLDFGHHRRLQTLVLSLEATTKIKVLPPNVRFLSLHQVTVPQKWKSGLEKMEILEMSNIELQKCWRMPWRRHEPLEMDLLQLNFSNKSTKLCTMKCENPVHVSGIGDMENMRNLELHCSLIEGWPSRFPKLEQLRVEHLQVDEGEKLIRMLSGDVPKLTSLYLEGDFSKFDNLQAPPPKLPSLVKMYCRPSITYDKLPASDLPSLPAIISASSLQNLQSLSIAGFSFSSDDQVNALHGLQNLTTLELMEGKFPPSLFGLSGVFLQLKKVNIFRVNLGEFPSIGEGSLPQLSHWGTSHGYANSTSIKELIIGACPGNFQLDSLEELYLTPATNFEVLPAALLTSPCFKTLTLYTCKEFERVVVEPQVEHEVAASSIETLSISDCPNMRLEDIPEVFKRMEQAGKLKIRIS